MIEILTLVAMLTFHVFRVFVELVFEGVVFLTSAQHPATAPSNELLRELGSEYEAIKKDENKKRLAVASLMGEGYTRTEASRIVRRVIKGQ